MNYLTSMENNKYLSVSICLSDIPKEQIFTSERSGKKFVTLQVARRKNPSPYGDTHTVVVRVKNANGMFESIYVGKATEKSFGASNAPQTGNTQVSAPAPTITPSPAPAPPPAAVDDDLPF